MNRKYHKRREKDAKKRPTNARRQNARALLAFKMARARFWLVRMRVDFIQEIRVGWMENAEEDDIFCEVARVNESDEDGTMQIGGGCKRGVGGHSKGVVGWWKKRSKFCDEEWDMDTEKKKVGKKLRSEEKIHVRLLSIRFWVSLVESRESCICISFVWPPVRFFYSTHTFCVRL